MNYELANQLKEAGLVWEEMGNLTLSRYETFPTLEELIEACGDDFLELKYWWEDRVGEFETHKEWRARSRIPLPEWSVGATPTEAVARLWLALHKQEDVVK